MKTYQKQYIDKLKDRIRKDLKQIEEKRYIEEDCFSFRYWFQNLMPRYLEDYKRLCKYADKKYVDEIIYLFNESDEYSCSKSNKYDVEYVKALKECFKKYGFKKPIFEIKKYKDLYDKWKKEEAEIMKYTDKQFDKALDKLKKLC